MYAYTFQAELGGAYIAVPEELRNKKRKATFFVVMEDAVENEGERSAHGEVDFTPFIPTKGFKFNREEANER